jgi:hypothetical protein
MGLSVHMSAPVWALITHRDGGYNVSSAVSTHTVGHGRKELRGRVTSMREKRFSPSLLDRITLSIRHDSCQRINLPDPADLPILSSFMII